MALPQPRAVLFDLDGTLVDTVEIRIQAWLEALAEAGLPATTEQIAPLIGIDGKRLVREVAAGIRKHLDDERIDEIDRLCGEIFERLNRSPRALPGVSDVIAALDQREIPWAIATSSRREQVGTSVAALGLAGEPVIVDGSQVEHAKPEPDLLLAAAQRLGVDSQTCWCVGDSTWDMVAAKAAGMIPVAVTAGSAVSRADLEAAGAAAVVSALDGIVPHLPSRERSTRR